MRAGNGLGNKRGGGRRVVHATAYKPFSTVGFVSTNSV
jgi:hypothetical protein